MNPTTTTNNPVRINKIIYILFFFLLTNLSCQKEFPLYVPPVIPEEQSLPFENENIKMELITDSAPGNIRDIYFFNPSKAIAVTFSGKIYLSNDSGNNWILKYSNPITDQPLYQIFFTDENTGYVVGGNTSCLGNLCTPPGGIILKTIDGGINWSTIYQMTDNEIMSIASNTSGDLFIVSNGTKGRISKSIDAGNTWTTFDSTIFQLNKIVFKDSIGFCTGMKGNILKSKNNGNTWDLIATLDALYATDIKFIGDIGYCMANNLSVYKTIDFGINWIQVFHSEQIFYGLNPLTEKDCLIYGSGGYTGGCFGTFYGGIGQTTNSGIDWNVIQLKSVPSILCTSFYSPTNGYIVGGFNKGYIIKVSLK